MSANVARCFGGPLDGAVYAAPEGERAFLALELERPVPYATDDEPARPVEWGTSRYLWAPFMAREAGVLHAWVVAGPDVEREDAVHRVCEGLDAVARLARMFAT